MAYQAALGMCMPLYTRYAQTLGHPSLGGLIIAAPSISRVTLNLRVGPVADQFGRKPLLMGGSVVMAVGALGTAMAQ